LALLALAACSSTPVPPRAQSTTVAPTSVASSQATGVPLGNFDGLPLGRIGCAPASPVVAAEVRGTAANAELWGLIMTTSSTVRVGDDVKIVWRMTGTGDLVATATAPSGNPAALAWGPDAHGGSNYDRPGDEWGVGYVFTEPGCWHLALRRTDTAGDVWLDVQS
jgi:hypothetical protein